MEFPRVGRVVLIFVDGLGVGAPDPERNPLAHVNSRFLGVFDNGRPADLPHGGVARPLDACLDLEGIPQSATGQTALLTGINAAQALNRHLFGFPNKKLQQIILEHSVLKRARDSGLKAAFINAFRPRFFELGESVWEKAALSVTTWTNRAANLPFFALHDLQSRRSVYQEFTNQELIDQGFDVPLFTPQEAGEILARRSRDFDFLLYEYFRTDNAGHRQDMENAAEEIRRLDAFLGSFLEQADLEDTLVLLTSDHGNIEDLSVRGHTRNRALTVLWGSHAQAVAVRLESIQDVSGVLLQCLCGRSE